MKTLRGPLSTVVFTLAGLTVLVGCGQNNNPKNSTSTKIHSKDSKVAGEKSIEQSLKVIREKFDGKSHLLVLEKNYWLNKKIWISLGIERATVSGLAGSVMGYVPAYLRQINGLLILERDNNGRFAGTTLTPETALNAYPIVEENSAAIVVDISQPKTEYGLTNFGFYAGSSAQTELKPRLEYVKEVSIDESGVAFKSVINAVSPVPLFETGQGAVEETAGLDPYSVSLTLRTDWVIPSPTADYKPLSATAQPIGYFYSAAKIEDGGLSATKYVNRIATTKKHVWEMSANTPENYRNAVRDGVLAWNEALGEEVLEVRVGDANKDNTDPKTSNIIWDDNKAVGFAFANWRDNPETGEIMQGQVYMSGDMWAEQAGLVYDIRKLEKLMREALDASRDAEEQRTQNPSNTESTKPNSKDIEKAQNIRKQISKSAEKLKKDLSTSTLVKRGFLTLNSSHANDLAHKGFCQRELHLGELRDLVSAVILIEGEISSSTEVAQESLISEESIVKTQKQITRVLKHMPYPADDVTREAFQESVVRSVVMHEVGHALGLRHNFMGSLEKSERLAADSTSIMDYNDLVVDAQFDKIGDADLAMINMGYHRQAPDKQYKFCTDEHAAMGIPGCHRHDYSSDSVDFFVTAQETSLLMALYFGQRGDMARLVRNINNALRWSLEMMTYINLPTAEGLQVDAGFAQKQANALKAVHASRNMHGLPFPPEFQLVYENLSRMIFSSAINQGASQTPLKESVISDLTSTALDNAGTLDKDSRLAGVMGLIQLQDASARNGLKSLLASLQEQNQKQNAERTLESRMLDEFLQSAAKEALDSYYLIGGTQKN